MPAKIDPAAKYKNIPGLTEDVKAKLLAKDAMDAACMALVSKVCALRHTHAMPELREALNQMLVIANMKGIDIYDAIRGFVSAPK